MVRHLFLFILTCILLPVFLTGCNTSRKAVAHTALPKHDSSQTKFMDGVAMNNHNKKTAATHTTEPGKPYAHTTANKQPIVYKKPEENTTVADQAKDTVANDNAPPGNTVAASKSDTSDNKEPVGLALKKPEEIKIKEVNPAPVTDNNLTATSEVQGIPEDMPDPLIVKYSGLVSADPKDITNYPLYHFIDDWYGTEYKWGGNDNTGIDCSAFSQKLYREIYGVDLLRTAREQHRNCERIRHSEDAEEGDLIFFRTHRLRISHVGVYLTNGYFVHASSSQGVVISNLNDRYWRRRYAGCGRIEREETASSESGNLQ